MDFVVFFVGSVFVGSVFVGSVFVCCVFDEVLLRFSIFFCCEIELSQMIRFHKVVLAF